MRSIRPGTVAVATAGARHAAGTPFSCRIASASRALATLYRPGTAQAGVESCRPARARGTSVLPSGRSTTSVARQVALLVAAGAHRHAGADELGHPPSPLVVDDDDRRPRPRSNSSRLRAEVVLHVGVEVEMVLGQVRERADRELDAADPSHRQRVAGYLHRDVGRAALAHHREQRLQSPAPRAW